MVAERTQHYIRGMASILQIVPIRKVRKHVWRLRSKSAAESLCSDWAKLAKDYRLAFEKITGNEPSK